MVTNAEKLLMCAEELGRECSCWEVGSCSFASDPLSTMILPFESIFAGLSFVIFWGLILSILWLRTHNPLMVGMIGTVMSSAFIAGGGAVTPEMDKALTVGGILLMLSLGIALYQIISSRLYAPPN